METIKYSIIIPHYNTPDLLVRCLNSIPEREYIQVIVVDDQSPNHESFITSYSVLSRSNVEFHVVEESKGAGHARNVGLKYVKGEKIIFADSDDFFVSEIDNILKEFENDDSDIIYFNTIGVFSDDITKLSNRSKDKIYNLYKTTNNIDIFRYKYTEPWGKIIKKDLIFQNNISFDETHVSNDQMFSVLTGINAKKIKAINRAFYIVTVRENSLSYKNLDTKEKLDDRLYVMARVQSLLQKKGYIQNEMMIFNLSVNYLKRFPISFLFIKIPWLYKLDISIPRLFYLILKDRVFSPSKRVHKDVNKPEYKKRTE